MKLEDVKAGQILKDKFGNKFEVTQIDTDDHFMPVELKCVEFVKDVCIGCDKITKSNFHSCVWVLKDRSRMLSSDSIIGEFLKEHFSNTKTFGELEIIDLMLNGDECRFLFGDANVIKKIDVTLKDLCLNGDEECPIIYNTRIDDIIIDKNGTEYRIIAKYSTGIEIVYSTEFTGIDDKVFNVNAKMYIPFYNSGYTDDVLTTKEFKKK